MTFAALQRKADSTSAKQSPAAGLRVGPAHDSYEHEADRVAAHVTSGGNLGGWSLSKLNMSAAAISTSNAPTVQRDSNTGPAVQPDPQSKPSPGPKPDNYDEAAKKIGEALLKTEPVKKMEEAAKKDTVVKGAEAFLDTWPGKIITGAAAVGAVSALAATHTPLPLQIPEIPLDKIKPGLTAKIVYEGPVDHPTSASITFSFTPKGPDEKKTKEKAAEKKNTEYTALANQQAKDRENYKTPQQRQQDAEDAQHAINFAVGRKNPIQEGIDSGRYSFPKLAQPTGFQLGADYQSPLKPRQPSLLDQKLDLKPLDAPKSPDAPTKKEEPAAPVQRKAAVDESAAYDTSSVSEVLNRSGRPLDPATRRAMETRFGYDFSRVRVHTDGEAATSARAVSAHAYTVGQNVVFASGKFAPDTAAGRKLLAHELTHVVQQTPALAQRPVGNHAVPVRSAPTQIQRDTDEEAPEAKDSGNWFTNPGEKIKGFIRKIPGYKLFSLILGKDPITGDKVDANATNLLGALFNLVPGGDTIFQRIQESGAIEKAKQWVLDKLNELDLNWNYFAGLIDQALHSINWRDVASPKAALQRIYDMFKPAFDKVKNFASAAADKVLEIAMEAALALIGGTGILETLREAGAAFRTIVKDPVGFLKNLIESLKLGFNQFKDHILDHLKNSILDLLFGAVAKAGIKLPSKFGLAEIIGLILQVLGLTYDNFRLKMVGLLGEEAVAFLEGSFDFLMKIVQAKSLSVVWKMIIEKADNLIDSVLDGVKSWVVNKIVTIAIVKLAALFNPVGAIVQAIQAIYKTITYFIDKAKQLKALVDAVVKSIANIAAGKLSDAANYVENSMAGAMTQIIAFLAEQFGLGDIGKKVKEVIDSVQAKVNKAIDGVVNYIVAKGKGFYEKSKDTIGKVLEWWKQKKVVMTEGKEHSIYMDGTEDAPKLLVASSPGVPWSEYLEARKNSLPKKAPKKQKDLLDETKKLATDLEKPLAATTDPAAKSKNVEEKRKLFNQVAKAIIALGFSKEKAPASVIKYDPPRSSDEGGVKASASILSTDHPKGTAVSRTAPPPIYTKLGSRQKHYVQGHLLNKNLGGQGMSFNLSPITRSANKQHSDKIEETVKDSVNNDNKVMRYKVEAIYGTHAKSAKFQTLLDLKNQGKKMTKAQDGQLAEFEAEQNLPVKFEWEARELKRDGDKWVDDTDTKPMNDHVDTEIMQ